MKTKIKRKLVLVVIVIVALIGGGLWLYFSPNKITSRFKQIQGKSEIDWLDGTVKENKDGRLIVDQGGKSVYVFGIDRAKYLDRALKETSQNSSNLVVGQAISIAPVDKKFDVDDSCFLNELEPTDKRKSDCGARMTIEADKIVIGGRQ